MTAAEDDLSAVRQHPFRATVRRLMHHRLFLLGLGLFSVVAVPPTPTWGNIMAEGRQYMIDAPWIIAIPGIALMITVLGLNLLGDGLRDVLDPRLRIQS